MYIVEYVPLEKLDVSPYNARQRIDHDTVHRLYLNIYRHGLLNPLIVTPPEKEGGKYLVVSGRLRLEALRKLKAENPARFKSLFPEGVPCVVRDLSPQEALVLSLSENIRRGTMSKEEVGAAIERLQTEFGLSREEITRELQLVSSEIDSILRVYRALRTSITAPSPRPGRPRIAEKKRRPLARTSRAVIASLAKTLKEEGVVEDEEKFAERLSELAAGLSVTEVKQLAARIRREPDIVREEGRLRRLVEELKREEMVDRIVSLKASVVKKLSLLAAREGKTFNEVLNEVLEKALKTFYPNI